MTESQSDNKRRVLFLSDIDWANVSTILSNSISKNSLKYKSDCVCFKAHPFNYTIQHQFDLCSMADLKPIDNIIDKTDIIIFCQEFQYERFRRFFPGFDDRIKGKKRLIYHAYYAIDNNKESDYIFQLMVPELHHLGTEKARVVIPSCPLEPPKDIGNIIESRRKNDKIVISHCCSRGGENGIKYKGSLIILEQVNKILKKYPHVVYKYLPFENRMHQDILNTKNETDIYIDQYNNDIGGFGVSSLESLNHGCIVLCSINKLTPEFKRIVDFDNFPIYDISGDQSNIYTQLDKLCQMSKDEIAGLEYKTVDWVNKNLSDVPYRKYFEENILDLV